MENGTDNIDKLHRNPLIRDYLDTKKKIETLQEKIIQDAIDSWHIMVDLAHNSKNETIKLNATKDIMDRAGFKAVERKEVSGRDGGAIIISDEEKMKISRLIDQVVK